MQGKLKGATMEFKPKLPTLRGMMFSAAVIFGGFAAVKLLHHDLNNGLWSFAVCLALVLGILPPWLTGSEVAQKTVKPEKYSLLGE
jgi:hypothetical protein